MHDQTIAAGVPALDDIKEAISSSQDAELGVVDAAEEAASGYQAEGAPVRTPTLGRNAGSGRVPDDP